MDGNYKTTKCYNCGYTGRNDFFWLVLNDDTGKAIATPELDIHDVGENDRCIEVDICGNCHAEQ